MDNFVHNQKGRLKNFQTALLFIMFIKRIILLRHSKKNGNPVEIFTEKFVDKMKNRPKYVRTAAAM